MLLKSVIIIMFYIKAFLQNNVELDIVNLVTDFLVKEIGPTKITAYVCWPKNMQLKLSRRLSERSYGNNIRSINSSIHYSIPKEHQMFLLDAECDGSTNILQQAHQLKLFNEPFRWLIWGADEDTFNGLHFGIDSRVFVVREHNLEYKIISLYNLANYSDGFTENYILRWRSDEGIFEFNEFSVIRSRRDLMGTTIRISFVILFPDTYNHLWDYRQKHVDALSKLSWLMTHVLISFVNVTSINIFRDTWGYKDPTTSIYTGLIGDLQTHQAELGGTPPFFTVDRIDIVDYIAEMNPTRLKLRFLFKAPPLTSVMNIFTLPFDSYVWYSSVVMCVAMFVVLYVIVFWEWKNPIVRKKLTGPQVVEPNIFDVILLEVGAITQQGSDAEPKSNAGRIATIFTLVALMFLYTSYSANIVALLQSTTESINSLEDLLNSRISLGVEDVVYTHHYFKNEEEPIRKKIYEQKVAPKGQKPNFMTLAEGIRKVQEGSFAFHVETSTGYKVIGDTFQESEKCSLKEIEYMDLKTWIVVRKKSQYKKLFKIGMQRLHESGIRSREINLLYTDKPTCQGQENRFGSVGLYDCYAAFLIFGIGVACSFILLLFEIFIKWYINRKKKRCINVALHSEEAIGMDNDIEFEFIN